MQNVKLLEKLQLNFGRSLEGLYDILSPRVRTFKVLDFAVSLYDESPGLSLPLLLVGLYNELQAMAGHNILEALSFEVNVDGCETENSSILHNVENSLVKPGWSTFRQVSFKLSITFCLVSRRTAQSFPRRYTLPIIIFANFQILSPLLSIFRLPLSY